MKLCTDCLQKADCIIKTQGGLKLYICRKCVGRYDVKVLRVIKK